VMWCKGRGTPATADEESKIYQLSLAISRTEGTMKPKYGVEFQGYMASWRNVHRITHDHLYPKI